MWLTKDTEQLIEEKNKLNSWRMASEGSADKTIRVITVMLILLIIFLFLPWTQNIQGTGIITTRSPEQRPQEINAVIAGGIERWWVREGDLVKKGDTILKLSEVKEAYLDPKLLQRTEEQIEAKEEALDLYREKVANTYVQLEAVIQAQDLKLRQLQNKIAQAKLYVQNDSVNIVAVKNELNIAKDQYIRQKELFDKGLKSLTELEQRKQALQNIDAKEMMAENKYTNAGNDLLNAQMERNQVEREYNEKITKITSDRLAILSDISTGEAEVAKLKNQFSNYAIRSGFYYVTAPQDGQITKTIAAGIGEVVKEGEMLVKVVPQTFQYAVEMYVYPIDLPLISLNQRVRFQFDGWPAIVFGGWQNLTFGTFAGRVVAIDNSISENGKFRILVAEDKSDAHWPSQLKVGGGAKGLAMLKDVPIWYELWRNLNGFPPDFYQVASSMKVEKSKKK